jgi:peptidoglycan hydrolase-like protein with peptidoglycan-binding domain
VTDLQQRLNYKLHLHIPANGVFDAQTLEAVRLFQERNWLAADGVAGPCTLSAINDLDQYMVLRTVHLVPQPTDTTCWAAATAMLLARNAPVPAPPGVNVTGGLPNDSDLDNPAATSLFTQHYGIHFLPPQSYQPSYLAEIMQAHAPLEVNTLWDASGYSRRLPTGRYQGSSGHFRIFAGIRGDGTAEGTTIRVYDPWPPKRGAIYSMSYKQLLGETLTLTYQLWYR